MDPVSNAGVFDHKSGLREEKEEVASLLEKTLRFSDEVDDLKSIAETGSLSHLFMDSIHPSDIDNWNLKAEIGSLSHLFLDSIQHSNIDTWNLVRNNCKRLSQLNIQLPSPFKEIAIDLEKIDTVTMAWKFENMNIKLRNEYVSVATSFIQSNKF